MVSYITDYIQNTATSYLRTGIEAAGSMAGNAVGGVGSLVESSGRNVGEGKASHPNHPQPPLAERRTDISSCGLTQVSQAASTA